jgi:hypothetical protein
MKTRNRIRISVALLLAVAASGGCSVSGLLGPNINVNLVVPLGFGGAPGLFNPFGIVQAVVNALLGEAFSATGDTTPTEGGETTPVDPGTIGAIVT